MDYLEKYNYWCIDPVFDENTKKELQLIKNNDKEIKDRFYKDLEFGTAGLRGIIGAGTNRMNKYTVEKATQGLANYIIKKKGQNRGVAIAYDSRNMSKEFSEYTAICLNANGVKTYIFDSLRSVPELSYAIRKLGCIAGVAITASHNPPKYNGYKVYWEDGAQIISPIDKEIVDEVNSIKSFSQIKTIDKETAIQNGLYNMIGHEINSQYITEVKKLVLNPEIIKQQQDNIKIVYTPLHGAGNVPVKKVLKELGFTNIYIVPEQEEPDGDFPTVDYPNPEDPKAFKLALELAEKVDADIVLGTDPDVDRLGVYSKDRISGKYMRFTGNMSGLLIAEYILSQKQKKQTLNNNGVLIKTIVSSNLADSICKNYGIELIEVLTGFKYIGEKIRLFEQTKEKEYIFGFEESYGCLVGTHARDKDAISAIIMLCEAAAYYNNCGLTLWDQMIKIYDKYGYYKEDIFTITLEGAAGAQKIKDILQAIRNTPLYNIGEYKVEAIRDYNTGIIKNLITNEQKTINLPKSNVLYYELENDAWCCIRPSGTEPKLKFYVGVKSQNMEESEEKVTKLKLSILESIEKYK